MTRGCEKYRVVVQHIRSVADERFIDRLAVDGGKQTFLAVSFESTDLLLRSLREAMPNLKQDGLTAPGIVLRADVELIGLQRALWGSFAANRNRPRR